MTTARVKVAQLASRGNSKPVSAGGATGSDPPVPVPPFVPFPIHCLPEKVQQFCRVVSQATTADPAYVGMPLLSVLGAAIGTTRVIIPKRGWKIYPTIWAVWIGRSSTAKSPPSAIIGDAVTAVEDKLDEESERLQSRYAEDLAKFENGELDEEPKKPPTLRFRVSDATLEALAPILSGNPRGLWLASDEASSWLDSFARYKGRSGGNDRSRWLSIFDSGSLTVDRKTGEPRTIRVRNTLVNIAGSIQPIVLDGLMTRENIASGLFARILLAYPPDRLTQWSNVEVDDGHVDDLANLILDLRRLGHEYFNGKPSPASNRLSPAARRKFVEYFNRNRERAFTSDDGEAASLVKLEAYALRFAHIRHLCRWSSDGDGKEVEAVDVERGIELAEWFACELARIQAAVAEPEDLRVGKRVLAWIRTQGGITRRELQRGQSRRFPTEDKAEEFLESLAKAGMGVWESNRAANHKIVRTFRPHPEPAYDADTSAYDVAKSRTYDADTETSEKPTNIAEKTGEAGSASYNVVRTSREENGIGSLGRGPQNTHSRTIDYAPEPIEEFEGGAG